MLLVACHLTSWLTGRSGRRLGDDAFGLGRNSGMATVNGAVIAAGIFGLIVAPFMSSLLRFFAPVVTGTIIAVIGPQAASDR
jgi:xanthine/uracil permease